METMQSDAQIYGDFEPNSDRQEDFDDQRDRTKFPASLKNLSGGVRQQDYTQANQ